MIPHMVAARMRVPIQITHLPRKRLRRPAMVGAGDHRGRALRPLLPQAEMEVDNHRWRRGMMRLAKTMAEM